MAQIAFPFDPHPAGSVPLASLSAAPVPNDAGAQQRDRVAFEIGRDHARHGLLPPAEHLHPAHPVRQGWQAGRLRFGRRTLAAGAPVQTWLSLRLQAWLAGEHFETMQLTPHYLAQLARSHCPVTGEAGTAPQPLQLCRINRQAGYAAGNLAALGARAAAALSGDAAISAELGGLGDGEWQRLRLLQSYVTPLDHEQAARLPLLVLPPNRLRLLNAVQGLQALVTLQLGGERWGARIAPLVEALPDAATRRDFQLFFHSLMARVLEGGRETDPQRLRLRMESAWLQARLQARWQRFALRLSAAQAEALLQRASRLQQGSTGLIWHAPDLATEGWGPDGLSLPGPDRADAPTPALRPPSGIGDPVRQFRRRQVRQVVEAE